MSDEDLTQTQYDVAAVSQVNSLRTRFGTELIDTALADGRLVVNDAGDVTTIDASFEAELQALQDAADAELDEDSFSDPLPPEDPVAVEDVAPSGVDLAPASASGDTQHVNFKTGVRYTR